MNKHNIGIIDYMFNILVYFTINITIQLPCCSTAPGNGVHVLTPESQLCVFFSNSA